MDNGLYEHVKVTLVLTCFDFIEDPHNGSFME